MFTMKSFFYAVAGLTIFILAALFLSIELIARYVPPEFIPLEF
mgnify:CR=1 FL=1